MDKVELRYHRGDEILWLTVWAQERLWGKKDIRIISFRYRKRWDDQRLRKCNGAQHPLNDKQSE